MKYYGIRYLDSGEIVTTWEDCQKKIRGVKGVKFKSFKDEKLARAFINSEEVPLSRGKERYSLYVDGSFSNGKNAYGYGYALIDEHDNSLITSGYGTGIDPRGVEMRNVAGELKAVMEGLNIVLKQRLKGVNIYYDYTGIEMWAKGLWKRNKELTQVYYEYIQSKLGRIDIDFIKVKSHSGNKYNDLADELAKKSIEEFK